MANLFDRLKKDRKPPAPADARPAPAHGARQQGVPVFPIGVPGLVGAGVYIGMASLFKIEEFQVLWASLRKRLDFKARQ